MESNGLIKYSNGKSNNIVSWLNLFLLVFVAVIGYFIGFGKMEQRLEVLEFEVKTLRSASITRTEFSYFIQQINTSIKNVDDKVCDVRDDVKELRKEVRNIK